MIIVTTAIIILAGCVFVPDAVQAQDEGEYNVAILLYDGVELLDFSGPGEVFGATSGFNVYTVSADGSEILSQGFVTVKPEYSIKNAPKPDILVLPGGGTGSISQNQEALTWIQQVSTEGGMNMSVCTGARILANAGLLDGLNVTTWHGFTGRLQELLPNSTVLENTRFVDSGNIITTAGVSAGIDGALHMVSRIKGLDVAQSTARYMEYDKWVPEDGMVDYENDFITKIKTQGLDQSLQSYPVDLETGRPLFFEGEMKNLAREFDEQNRIKEAAAILELNVRAYPNSIGSYELLAGFYKKLGKFAPPTQQEFMDMLTDKQVNESIELYKKTQRVYPGWKIFSEGYLNWMGYQYLQEGETNHAIQIFEMNAEAYPESANVYDSLGEAYLKKGDVKQARKNYEKALNADPTLKTAKEALTSLDENG